MVLFGVLLSCADGPAVVPDPHECIDPNVREWCTDDFVGGDTPCGIPDQAPDLRCGPYDVIVESTGIGSGAQHFLARESGVHVATVFQGDVHDDCPADSMWYGERIECDVACSYVADPVLELCP